MVLIITNELKTKIKGEFNRNEEVGLYGLVYKSNDRLALLRLTFFTGDKMSTPNGSIPQDYLQLAKETPDEYEILTGHMHSRKYGDKIQVFDPYWTVPVSKGLTPGDIVDKTFYVTRKSDSSGDTGALKSRQDVLSRLCGIKLDKTIFVHPRYGTEHLFMYPNMIGITCYQFDETNRFGVKEIPVDML